MTDDGITGGIYGWYGIYRSWPICINCDWIWAIIVFALLIVLWTEFPIIVLCAAWIIFCCLFNKNTPWFVFDWPYITEVVDEIDDKYWFDADTIGGQHGCITPWAL